MARSGPPNKKQIDPALVISLAKLHCTFAEIAAVVGCSTKTIERRFRKEVEQGREAGKASLRRMQWALAAKGNVAAQIWLGKQLLGQKDRIEHGGPGGGPIGFIMDEGERAARIASLLERAKRRAAKEPPKAAGAAGMTIDVTPGGPATPAPEPEETLPAVLEPDVPLIALDLPSEADVPAPVPVEP